MDIVLENGRFKEIWQGFFTHSSMARCDGNGKGFRKTLALELPNFATLSKIF